MVEAIPWVTAIVGVVGAIAALWRIHVERERNKVLRRQVELAEPRPKPEILGLRSTGGGGNFVTFTVEVQNVGTRATRARASARVGSHAVRVSSETPDLLVNDPPLGIEIAVPRPQLGDLMHACGHATTLYDETLYFRLEANQQFVEQMWHEDVYDEATDRALYEVQRGYWRRAGREKMPDDLRAESL